MLSFCPELVLTHRRYVCPSVCLPQRRMNSSVTSRLEKSRFIVAFCHRFPLLFVESRVATMLLKSRARLQQLQSDTNACIHVSSEDDQGLLFVSSTDSLPPTIRCFRPLYISHCRSLLHIVNSQDCRFSVFHQVFPATDCFFITSSRRQQFSLILVALKLSRLYLCVLIVIFRRGCVLPSVALRPSARSSGTRRIVANTLRKVQECDSLGTVKPVLTDGRSA